MTVTQIPVVDHADVHSLQPVGITRVLTNDTSRAYARKAKSRILPPWANKVLDAAANGEEFDAWIFQQALTQVLSAAATRDGQSMGRRNWTREARHLAYANQAVLDNALRGLPPVDPGQRSPKIAEQEREINDLRSTVRLLAEEKTRLEESVENLQRCNDNQSANLVETDDAWQAEKQRAKRLQRVLDYARLHLTPTANAQVTGFQDAVNQGDYR